jgi:excisionase family DNA binding protein
MTITEANAVNTLLRWAMSQNRPYHGPVSDVEATEAAQHLAAKAYKTLSAGAATGRGHPRPRGLRASDARRADVSRRGPPRARRRPVTGPNPLMTPAEVAAAFRVEVKTIRRWADAGKLTVRRTVGGHRRYLRSEVRSLLRSQGGTR